MLRHFTIVALSCCIVECVKIKKAAWNGEAATTTGFPQIHPDKQVTLLVLVVVGYLTKCWGDILTKQILSTAVQ